MSAVQPRFTSSGNINPSRFVVISGDNTVAQAGAGARTIGICQEGQKKPPLPGETNVYAAEQYDPIEVFGIGQEVLLELGGTVTANDPIKPDANGKGVQASGTDLYGAVAKTGGASGEKIMVIVERGRCS
jgi:hypothetical protein